MLTTTPHSLSPGLEDVDEVDRDNIGPSILKEEVVKAIKQLKTKKAPGCDGISAELIKELGPSGTDRLVGLCQDIYETGKWPEDYTRVKMVPIPKKSGTQKCGEHRTLSMISHPSKVELVIIKERLESKIEQYLGKDQYGFRKGRGTRDAIGALRILGERSIEVGKEMNVCFIDYEKAFDRVDWKKLMDILKKIGLDWKDRRLIANLYLDQTVTVQTEVGLTEACQVGRGCRQGCILSPPLFNLYSGWLIEEALIAVNEGVKVGGELVPSIRYADDSSLMSHTETGLQRMLDSVVEHAKMYGMKINIAKTKVMKIARDRDTSLNIYINGSKLEEVTSFRYLGSLISNNGSCTNDIKARIGAAKAAFYKNKVIQSRKISLRLRVRLAKCYIWSIATYAAETWTVRAEEKRLLECFERWIWRKLLGIRWQDRVSNEDLLQRTGLDGWELVLSIQDRKERWLRNIIRQGELLQIILEGKLEGKKGRGRPRIGILNEIGNYQRLKDRTLQ